MLYNIDDTALLPRLAGYQGVEQLLRGSKCPSDQGRAQ